MAGLRSMTGFGRGEASDAKWKVVVELATVNRKQFDCALAMPRELISLDARLQALFRSELTRGAVKGTVLVEPVDATAAAFDAEKLRARVAALRQTAAALGLRDDLTAASLAAIASGDSSLLRAVPEADSVWPTLERAASAALKALCQMRETEGAVLEKDLRTRLDDLRTMRGQLARRAPDVPREGKAALEKRLAALLEGVAELDPQQIAREAAVLADRCDVSEELTRLDSHFAQFDGMLKAGGACGRSLDFLCQEMFREINTTGSKANDAEMTRGVIAFKAKLETVREQVQNVE